MINLTLLSVPRLSRFLKIIQRSSKTTHHYFSFRHSVHSKRMSPAYHRFLTPPPPLSHFVTVCLDPPTSLVTTKIVINFELIVSRPLMQILDLIFAKMCIFSTQTLLSTWKATLKSRWSGVITTFKVILMRFLKRYIFEVDITL